MSYKEKLRKIKEEQDNLIDEVFKDLKDNPRTIEESLEILSELPEIPTCWLEHPIQNKYGEELKKIVWESDVGNKKGQMPDYHRKNGYDKYTVFYDEFLFDGGDWGRGSVIDLRQQVEGLLDDGNHDNLTVLTNRTTKDKIVIPSRQAAQDLIDWMIENKVTGITFDW